MQKMENQQQNKDFAKPGNNFKNPALAVTVCILSKPKSTQTNEKI